jgi:hypothetical protein
MSEYETTKFAPQKYEATAIVGFILSFVVALPGLIVSIIGYRRSGRLGTKGRGLALAGIIISAVSMVIGGWILSQS